MAACASTSTCPPIKQYDRQWNNELAAELATAGPRTVEALSDYSVLRRQLEQCQ